MEFEILKASDFLFKVHEKFETLEQLRDYVLETNERNSSCVIYWDTMRLVIYDDWIE